MQDFGAYASIGVDGPRKPRQPCIHSNENRALGGLFDVDAVAKLAKKVLFTTAALLALNAWVSDKPHDVEQERVSSQRPFLSPFDL